ncbi:hypothetical protein J4411_00010 [Candidatus Pacearchaeota archaeon]|nr:hypothetical protein [Candidatus Pacearchaeota archaeon]
MAILKQVEILDDGKFVKEIKGIKPDDRLTFKEISYCELVLVDEGVKNA